MNLWTATLRCADCGAVLNTAKDVPDEAKARVNISSAFAAGNCPNGCRASFSDLNINTTLEWQEQP